MNQKELLTAVAATAEITQVAAKKTLDAFFSVVQNLKDGESLCLRGFGTFKKATVSARTVTPPGTGKPMKIPAHIKLKFKVSKAK